MPDYDLLIRNGNVIDGTGAPATVADLAVARRPHRRDRRDRRGGPPRHRRRRPAVTPGFIDVHAHDDGAVLSTTMDFKLMQGVTTDIVGNCGAGLAPRDPAQPPMPGIDLVLGALPESDWRSFSEYMDTVDRASLAVNVGCFVPHGAVRYHSLGMNRRDPSAESSRA